jgi:hypothetical protein
LPKRDELQRQVDEAERVLSDIALVKQEVQRLLADVGA